MFNLCNLLWFSAGAVLSAILSIWYCNRELKKLMKRYNIISGKNAEIFYTRMNNPEKISKKKIDEMEKNFEMLEKNFMRR